MSKDICQLAVNTLRFLSVEMVQKANSGHPGLPMGAAPAAFTLWASAMKHNPADPNWPDRDRFVLSAGHGSSLLYSLLHVFGYGLTIDDLKRFRQWNSLTPGHPEYRHTPGVEITTGPLGQGIANAVGFAWAESYLAAKFNKPEHKLVDHYTYALCGDGCLMEGIAAEAASLAGTLALGKLILLYDSNNITIEGSTDIAFRESVMERFNACGWHTQKVADGNDLDAILAAVNAAKAETSKPSLIEIKTVIGYGAPNRQGTAGAHGSPLGDEEIKLAKARLNWPYQEAFTVPEALRQYMSEWRKSAQANQDKWQAIAGEYAKNYPEDWREWQSWHSGKPSEAFDAYLQSDAFWQYEGDIATRVSSERVLNRVVSYVPNLIGGAADLAPSTNTIMKGRGDYSAETPEGANLHFGIREHAMTAIANGMAAHGGLRPYVAGFFVFSDYMKPAMRLSALMKLPVIYIMTHDSIGVGEDGPTHEPVEQLAALRSMPNFTVIRPCDTHETAAAWALALCRTSSPTALVLSRQNLPLYNETGKGLFRGAYVLSDNLNPATGLPDIILMASGSEVSLMRETEKVLLGQGIYARVVSFPSFEIFDEQDDEYKESVLPGKVRARLAAEAAASFGWHKYVGLDGAVVAVNGYGASAPAGTLFKEYGFTVENAAEKALALLSGQKQRQAIAGEAPVNK